MIERHPLSNRILKGDIWRIRATPRKPLPVRTPTPEMIEADRLVREREIRIVEERRRRREAERGETS
jgi:hypothetical protein